ncbi:LEPR-XLL domain-containing protein [Bradyrhizobium tropiciagri]|uniref:LEPR-XLL domain-containing protein n=1 Tax=Bradyrhizobium tropiciagri TaxID=312253 RepID=UPI00067A916C|nr:LEPR-XLL domain-containing protein [Bradyrhizobium tropiciagri]
MGIHWRWNKEASKRSPFESLLDKVVRELFPERYKRKPRRGGASRPVAQPRRQTFTLEAMEPRLLLSADISYSSLSVHDFTLKAVGNTLTLVDTATNASEGSKALGSGDNTVSIARSPTGDFIQDIIRIDVDMLSTLDGTIGAGHTLTISFDGGDQRFNGDTVTLENREAGSGYVGYNLAVTTNSHITSSASVNVTGDLTLESKDTAGNADAGAGLLANADTGITLSGATLTASHNLTLTSDSTVTVSPTDGDGSHTGDTSSISDASIVGFINSNLGNLTNETGVSLVTSFSHATIDIGGGSQLSATSGDIKILSSVDGSIETNTANASRAVTIAVTAGKADPNVTIHGLGTLLTAGGKIDATATTNFTKFDVAATSKGNSDTKLDGAVAVSVFNAGATLDVSDSAKLNATGATTLTASSTLPMTVKGDASTGGTAGAGVAVAVVLGDTTASVTGGAEIDGSAVTLASSSSRTITTTADASGQGSDSSIGDKNASETALSNNKAATSDGSINIAGAVAVTVDNGKTSASLVGSTINAGGGGVMILATPVDVVTTAADASFTNNTTSTGVGVAVAINIADERDNTAFVGGSSSITAGSLTVAVGALNNGVPDPGSLAQSSFNAIAVAGVSSKDNGVAGAFAINVIIGENEAYVDNAASVTLTGSPNVLIEADANIKEFAKAVPVDGGATGGKLGVGASVAVDYSEDTTAAYIGDNATLTGAKNLSLNATSAHGMTTFAQNGATASSGTGLTPVVAISAANNDAYTTIGIGTGLMVGGDLKASSTLTDTVSTTASGNTDANTGIGVSLALSIVNDDSTSTTKQWLTTGGVASFVSSAFSGSESTAKASVKGGQKKSENPGDGGDTTSADDKKNAQQGFAAGAAKNDGAKKSDSTKNASSPSATSGDGGVSVAGAIAINLENASSVASIPDGIHVTATNMVAAKSSNNSDGHAVADASASSGGTGVGVAVAVNRNEITNQGFIGNNTVITGGGLDVERP